jgi:ferredoxin
MLQRKYLLTFTSDIVNEPITYKIVKSFDLLVNILRADVGDRGGRLLISVEGSGQQIEKAVQYLVNAKVQVKELNEYVNKSDERCTDCGMCLSICPVDAFEIDRISWKISFNAEKCIACGMCVEACPPQAIKISDL